MIVINKIEEYNYCRTVYSYKLGREYQPLIDSEFEIDIFLRVEIQKELFGEYSPKNHPKFYRWFYDNHPTKCCEETLTPLTYNAANCSHILTKGAHPEMMYDPRNMNLIILEKHNIWEYGTEKQKMKLRIYNKNQQIIELLKSEYNKL